MKNSCGENIYQFADEFDYENEMSFDIGATFQGRVITFIV